MNNQVCAGRFSGGEIEPGTFHGGEIEPGTFHAGIVLPEFWDSLKTRPKKGDPVEKPQPRPVGDEAPKPEDEQGNEEAGEAVGGSSR